MDTLEADLLYEERGGVTFCRPILQGDIFARVALPGFDEAEYTVQIVAHPCSMRRGSVVNKRIQVAPIEPYQRVSDWNQHLRVQPLPDLREDGTDYATKFVDMTAVASTELTVENRVASLSHPGIHVLQQRLVMYWTRLDLATNLFREQSSPVLAEAEMQETWVEQTLGTAAPDVSAVEAAARSFQGWLDEGDKKRRRELTSEASHAGLRRAVRAAARSRQTPDM